MKLIAVGAINIERQLFVDQIPSLESLSKIADYEVTFSSKVLNAARIFSYFLDVSFLGFAGKSDKLQLLDFLKDNKIDSKNITFAEDKTGEILVYVDKDGQNAFSLYPGANKNLSSLNRQNLEILKDFDVVYSYTNIPITLMNQMIELKKKYGFKLILDTPNGESRTIEILKNADYFAPNRLELSQILKVNLENTDSNTILSQLKERGFKNKILVTLDKDGAVFFESDRSEFTQSNTVKVASVDTTGAGDIFRAIFFSNFLLGKDTKTTLDYAQELASESVTIKGLENTIHHIQNTLNMFELK